MMFDIDGIAPALASALRERGFETLTPVQEAVLDRVRSGDALVSAQTGSGKTVAFGLAIADTLLEGAERLGPPAAPLALVIAPTRELALQVKREVEWLYAPAGALVASCVGGMDYRSERRALERGAHIVAGTPGRLRDHIERHSLDLSALRAVVLDEADEMLDLGFSEDLGFILDHAPAGRRTLMFSATIPPAIENLAATYMKKGAQRIAAAGESRQHGDIEYRALTVAGSDRENAIVNVLRWYDARTALVFCSTRAAVTHLTARFNNRGFSVVALSGELSQSERTHALQAMRDGRARVCIATDVAARGIDLPHLDLVIHADLPTNPETLLHRSGRTGRAGRKGVSILIVPTSLRRKAERLLQFAKLAARWERPPGADDVLAKDEERIVGHAVLTEPIAEEEAALVDTLLARHDARSLAAAYARFARAGLSAPEELIPVEPQAKRARPNEGFGPSVWFALNVGRRQNAEPRWLLPMICEEAGLSRKDIGAIRLADHETYVEVARERAPAIEAAVARGGRLGGEIGVTPVAGPPAPGTAGKGFSKGQPKGGSFRGSPRPSDTGGFPAPRARGAQERTAKFKGGGQREGWSETAPGRGFPKDQGGKPGTKPGRKPRPDKG